MTQDMTASKAFATTSASTRTPMAFVVAVTLGLLAPPANATPEGWNFVTADGAVFQNGPAGETVTNVFLPGPASQPNNRHIMTWDSLNLGTQETLNYFGLDGFAVLNRVNANMGATQINGALNAMNGNVYIVNQAGVMFGQSATINVGSIYAAGGDILDSDFSAGVDHFFNLTGELTFDGTLNATDKVALFGSRVVNTGAISGRMITMAVGNDILINDLDSRISLRIDGQDMDATVDPGAGTVTPDLTGPAGVSNSGTIETSDGGGVTLAAGDLYGLAIHHSGEINSSGGTVDLVASGGAVWTDNSNPDVGVSGLISTSTFFTDAGEVNIAGPAVVIGSEVKAVGGLGAVSVIGHDNVILDAAGSLIADGGAFGESDGGSINVQAVNGTVWGAQGTSMSAKGGAIEGDGGTITVQGDSLALLTEAKVGAVNGAAGSLSLISGGRTRIDATGDALEPWDMTDLSTAIIGDGQFGRIGAADGQTLRTVDGHLLVSSVDELRFEASLEDLRQTATFHSSDLRFAIDSPSAAIHAEDVLVFDGGGVFEQDVELSSGSSIGLYGGDFHGTGTAHVSLLAAETVTIENNLGGLGSELGHLTVSTSSLIDFGGHDYNDAQAIHVSGDVTLGGTLSGEDGPLQVGVQEGLVFNVGGDLSVGGVGGQPITVQAQESIEVNVGGHLFNAANADVMGSLRLTGGSVENRGILNAQGDLSLVATTGTLQTTGDLTTGADLLLQSFDALTNVHDLTTGTGSITLRSTNSDVHNTGTLDAATDLVLDAAGGLTSNGMLTAADIVLNASLQMDVAADATASGTIEVTTAGDLETSGVLTAQDVSILTGGDAHLGAAIGADDVVVNAGLNATIDAAITGGDGTVDLAGDTGLTINDDVSSNGAVTLASSDGDVTTAAAVAGDTISMSSGGDSTVGGTLDATSIALTAGGTTAINAAVTAGDGGLDIAGTGDVTIAAATTSDATTSIRSTAGTVAINDTVSGTQVSLDAGEMLTLAGDVAATSGDITTTSGAETVLDGALTSAGGVAIDAGSVSGTGLLQAAGDFTVNTTTTAMLDGSIQVSGTTTVQAGTDARLSDFDGGDLQVTSGGSAQLVSVQSSGLLDVDATGAATLTGDIDAATIDIVGGSIAQASNTTLGQTAAPGRADQVTLHATGDVTLDGAVEGSSVSITGANVGVNDVASAGDLTMHASGSMMTSGVVQAATVLDIVSGSALVLGGTTSGHDVTINAGTTAAVNGALDGDDIMLTADSGIEINDTITAGDNGLVAMTNSGTVAVNAAVSSVTDDVSISGDAVTLGDDGDVTAMTIALDATDSITGSGDLSGDASVSVEAMGGDIQLSGDVTSSSGDVLIVGNQTQMDGNVSGTTVALTGSEGLVVNGDITANEAWLRAQSGLVTSNGQTHIDGAVNWIADQVEINGLVDAQGAADIQGTSGVALNATVTAGSVSVSADQGAVSVVAGVTGASGIDITGEDITLDGSAVLDGGPVTLAADSMLISNGLIDSSGDVSLTSNDVLTVAGDVSADGNVTMSADALTLDAGAALTAHDVSLDAQDTLATSGTIDASGSVDLTTTDGAMTIDGGISGAQVVATSGSTLSITALLQGGAVHLEGVGDVRVDQVDADSIVARSTTGLLDLAGALDASGDMTLSGSTVLVQADVLAGGDVALTATDGAVIEGAMQAGHLAMTTGGNLDVGGNLAADDLVADVGGDLVSTGELVADAITLNSGGSTSAQRIYSDTLNITAQDDITVNEVVTSGLATLDGDSVHAHGTLNVGALEILAMATSLDGEIDSAGHVSIASDTMTLEGDSTIQAVTDLVLSGRDPGAGDRMAVSIDGVNLTLEAGDTMSLLGTVDGLGGSLAATANGGLLVGGDIGAIRSLDSIDLASSQLQLGGFGWGALNTTWWHVGQISAQGDIGLNAANLLSLPDLPAVFGFGTGDWSQPAASLSLTSTGGDIVIGHNQGFSYYGDLTLDAASSLTIGHVTALGDLTLRGDTINVHQETPGTLLEPGGAVELLATSIVSGGFLTVDGTLNMAGPTENGPRFAGVDGASGVPISARSSIAAFGGADMRLVNAGRTRATLLALAPAPPVTPGESDIIAAEQLVHDDPEVQYIVGNEDLTSLVALADLGVSVQDTLDTVLADTQRARSGMITANLAGADVNGRVQVSRNRLNVGHASEAIRAWNSVLAAAPGAGDISSVADDLNMAYTQYAAQAGDAASEPGFEAWARTGDSPIQVRADSYITGLRNAFTRLELAGLTRSEIAVAQAYVSRQLEVTPATSETASTSVDIHSAG